MYKVASWNVNSVRARLESLFVWLQEFNPDVLVLQETKVENIHFPKENLEALGYHVVCHGQKSYNGVAVLSREAISEVQVEYWDTACRFLAFTVKNIRMINVYVPNGQSVGSDKYAYKLEWLAQLYTYLVAEKKKYPYVLIMGDFNIAPEDKDVCDPKAWSGSVLVSPAEREALKRIMQLGFLDSFRLFSKAEDKYSWWDYRTFAFKRNMGLRIDLILMTESLKTYCQSADIDKIPRSHEKPSDHAPVFVCLKDIL